MEVLIAFGLVLCNQPVSGSVSVSLFPPLNGKITNGELRCHQREKTNMHANHANKTIVTIPPP
jgi:hypothetical protein